MALSLMACARNLKNSCCWYFLFHPATSAGKTISGGSTLVFIATKLQSPSGAPVAEELSVPHNSCIMIAFMYLDVKTDIGPHRLQAMGVTKSVS